MQDPEENKKSVCFICDTCKNDWESIGKSDCCPFCGNTKIGPVDSAHESYGVDNRFDR